MLKVWTDEAWDDYLRWQSTDRKLLKRVNLLIRDIERNGMGLPEPLRGNLSGYWSRRIDSANRIVYRIRGVGDERRLEIISCRTHYGDR
ncbi:addiction module protein [Bifidobacterium sp. DSM 109958]|uniref:Endoribonuclease YoeB n=1 Tax=Bifidobacterium moraviense TaxID=2675323 RepID=A0A7Y0HX98_9BIFI|nr:Txe/YoeB family addiction module toxin [Bifidobacterium sp. DSM 109958]NMN00051.1 addiction module protein [Bifidobacterium sp. DSM 109958]